MNYLWEAVFMADGQGIPRQRIRFLAAKERGINLIDADHFCTENVIIPVLYEKLRAQFPTLAFAVSRVHAQTAQTYCP